MDGLSVETTNDKLVISIDKGNFSESVLLKVMKIARTEYLINKADFNKSLLEIDEEMKNNWWQQNKDAFINNSGK